MYFGEHVDYIESLWFFRPKITVFMYMHNKLPSFFVVGAQKAGTSYLHNMLSEDPRIFLPRIKETHFFNDGKGEFYRGVDFYIKKYFNNAPNYTIKGEVDPEYLYFSKSAKRIAQAIPEAKLIFLFRKPAERAFSHYSMSYRRGIELLSFEEALTNECTRLSNSSIEKQSDFSYRDRGLYGKQVEVFLNYFSIKQMLFIDSLEFWNNTNIVMERIYNFIGVNYEKKMYKTKYKKNRGGVPKNLFIQRLIARPSFTKNVGKKIIPRVIRKNIRKYLEKENRYPGIFLEVDEKKIVELRNFYKKDVQLLTELTGQDFSNLVMK